MHHSSSEENHFQSFVFLINLYHYIVVHCREYISMNRCWSIENRFANDTAAISFIAERIFIKILTDAL